MLQLLVCVRVSRGTSFREGRLLTRVSCRSVDRSALRRRSCGAAGRLPGRRGGWWLGSHLRLCCAGAAEIVISPTRISRVRVPGVACTRPLYMARISSQPIDATGVATVAMATCSCNRNSPLLPSAPIPRGRRAGRGRPTLSGAAPRDLGVEDHRLTRAVGRQKVSLTVVLGMILRLIGTNPPQEPPSAVFWLWKLS